MKKSHPTYYVPALEKGLDILEALSVSIVPQTLADLARSCNRTGNEIFRMVDALEKRTYIRRDPVSAGYELTLKLYELAHTHSPIDHLLKASQFPMRDLAASLHESCHLCVLSNGELLVVASAESPDSVRLTVEIGRHPLPLTTVSGRLLFAALEDSVQEKLLEQDDTYNSLSIAGKRKLRSELAVMCESGFHLASSSVRTGIDVSCLIGSPEIGLIAALGVPFMAGGRNDGKEQSLIPTIQKHAKLITRYMGLGSPPTERIK